MGCYLNSKELWKNPTNKLNIMLKQDGVTRLEGPEESPDGFITCCVVQNDMFDAILVCHEKEEFSRTINKDDLRLKTYISVPIELALKMADYDWRKRDEKLG